MVKLKALPSQAIIDGFKGTADFYINMGIPCARAWPRSPGHRRTPSVEAQWIPFSYIQTLASILPAEIIDWYKEMAAGTPYTWKDYLTRAYIAGIDDIKKLNPIPLTPSITEYFAITSITQTQLPTGWKTILTTDTACTMLMFWTDREPRKHMTRRIRRGLSLLAMASFGFVYTRELWQREPEDSYTHTFHFISMPEDQTRYFATIAFKTRWLMKSTSPIMHKTILHGWRWPILIETWDNPYLLPPHMQPVIRESWTPTEPPTFIKLFTELWYNPYETPPTLTKILTELWTLYSEPPPMPTNVITEPWTLYSNPPPMIKILTEPWTQ